MSSTRALGVHYRLGWEGFLAESSSSLLLMIEAGALLVHGPNSSSSSGNVRLLMLYTHTSVAQPPLYRIYFNLFFCVLT